MNSGRLKVFSLFLALTMVFSGVATAQTTNETTEDSWLDTVTRTTNCNFLTKILSLGCHYDFDYDYSTGSADTVQDSVYNQMQFAKDSRDSDLNNVQQYINRTYGIAMSRAKLTAIEELNNGTSESQAITEATQDINDFYATQQKRLIETRNREVLKVNSTVQSISATDSLTVEDVIETKKSGYTDWAYVGYSSTGSNQIDISESNYTLYDGSNATIYSLTFNGVFTGGESQTVYNSDISTATTPWMRFTGSSGSKSYLLDKSDPYASTYQQIDSAYDRSINNTQEVVSQIFANYQQGEIDSSEVLGSLEATQLASTSYESTGKYSYVALSLEQMGLYSDNASSFTVSWTEDNQTVTKDGQLFVSNDFNKTLESGTTYNTNKTVFYVYQATNDSAETKSLTGQEFTIEEMRNTDTGETINSTTVQQNDYYTVDTTDLQQQLKEIKSLYSELKTSGGWFGGFDGFGSFSSPQTIVIAVLGLLLAGAFWS